MSFFVKLTNVCSGFIPVSAIIPFGNLRYGFTGFTAVKDFWFFDKISGE